MAAAGWAGLGRLSVVPAMTFGGAAGWHGALMVTAIATLIAVERATVVRRPWAWAAPVLSALGAIALILGASTIGGLLITASAAVVVVVMVRGAAATPGIAVVLMTLGAVAWLVSALLFFMLELPLASVVPWWSTFLVLTIAGERHELARVLRPSRAAALAFTPLVALCVIATAIVLVDRRAGTVLLGIAQICLALWLIVRDRPLRASLRVPLARYIGVATRLAYVWLAVAGTLNIAVDVPAGLSYDAALHALFVGFVITMILAHAPIVLPAILGGAVGFQRSLYAPLVTLSVSVAVRVAADLLGSAEGRAIGAVGVGIALPLFAVTMITSFRARRPDSAAAVRAAGLR